MSAKRMTLRIQPTGWTNDAVHELGNEHPYQQIVNETRFLREQLGH